MVSALVSGSSGDGLSAGRGNNVVFLGVLGQDHLMVQSYSVCHHPDVKTRPFT